MTKQSHATGSILQYVRKFAAKGINQDKILIYDKDSRSALERFAHIAEAPGICQGHFEITLSMNIPELTNVTVGWDATLRCDQQFPYRNAGYPCMAVLKNNIPENLGKVLEKAKKKLSRENKHFFLG